MSLLQNLSLPHDGLARRPLGNDRYEVFDEESKGFFYIKYKFAQTSELEDIHVDRKPGRGSSTKDDWELFSDFRVSDAINEWKAEHEDRKVTIEKPWGAALMASPVNRAWRLTKKSDIMVRVSKNDTWVSMMNESMFVPVSGPFKNYDSWEPMAADHRYAKTKFLLPGPIRLKDHVPVARKRKGAPAYSNPGAPAVIVSLETIQAAASIAQSLASAISVVTGEDRAKLVAELTRLSGHVSWHLREDRAKW